LFLELLRCFSSPGLPHATYVFSCGYLPNGRWVAPFGDLRFNACLSAPRSFSQTTTSFVACNRLGIRRMHLVAGSYNHYGYSIQRMSIRVVPCSTKSLSLYVIKQQRFELNYFAITTRSSTAR